MSLFLSFGSIAIAPVIIILIVLMLIEVITPFAVHLRKIYNHLRQQLKL